jgi:hypothetical protein
LSVIAGESIRLPALISIKNKNSPQRRRERKEIH